MLFLLATVCLLRVVYTAKGTVTTVTTGQNKLSLITQSCTDIFLERNNTYLIYLYEDKHITYMYVYTYLLMGYSIITYYWCFAARAVVASNISFLLRVYVRPVAVVGATWVRMSEGSMSIISSRLGYTNELEGMHG